MTGLTNQSSFWAHSHEITWNYLSIYCDWPTDLARFVVLALFISIIYVCYQPFLTNATLKKAFKVLLLLTVVFIRILPSRCCFAVPLITCWFSFRPLRKGRLNVWKHVFQPLTLSGSRSYFGWNIVWNKKKVTVIKWARPPKIVGAQIIPTPSRVITCLKAPSYHKALLQVWISASFIICNLGQSGSGLFFLTDKLTDQLTNEPTPIKSFTEITYR